MAKLLVLDLLRRRLAGVSGVGSFGLSRISLTSCMLFLSSSCVAGMVVLELSPGQRADALSAFFVVDPV